MKNIFNIDSIKKYDSTLEINENYNKDTNNFYIDSELGEFKRMINIVEVFIDYLRDCKRNCDSIEYFLKSDIFKNQNLI